VTELQIGLIGLGAAAVVGVLAYNKWQEYRHRRVAEQVMRSDHEDVLLKRRPEAQPVSEDDDSESAVPAPRPMPTERREPVLGGEPQPATDAVVESGERMAVRLPDEAVPVEVSLPRRVTAAVAQTAELPLAPAEPAFEARAAAHGDSTDEVSETAVQDGVPAAGDVPPQLLDPRIDFIVVMELVEPVAAEEILYSQRDALLRLNKPVNWVGFNERQREWELIPPGSDKSYRRLRIGLQLADRRGPLSEADFTVFVAAMQQLADELLAVADMQPRQSVLDQAVALDGFCAEVDLEIGVHLVSRATPFAGTKIRALAEAAGMTLTADGVFTRFDDDGRAQFRLQNFENTLFAPDTIKTLTTRGLTFLIDVPRVDHGEPVFFKMLDNARRFAESLQGQLVDDNRQPLNDAQLDNIRREFVVKPQLAMQKFGLPAGSPQALRLFS